MQKYHDEPKQYKGYLKSALAEQYAQEQTRLSLQVTSSGGDRGRRRGQWQSPHFT